MTRAVCRLAATMAPEPGPAPPGASPRTARQSPRGCAASRQMWPGRTRLPPSRRPRRGNHCPRKPREFRARSPRLPGGRCRLRMPVPISMICRIPVSPTRNRTARCRNARLARAVSRASGAARSTWRLLGVFAEFERETIIDRVTKGMAAKAAKGKWPGGTRPYGYWVDRDTHKLVPHPEEAPHLKEIFRLYADERLGTRAIAAELNRRGVRNRTGKPWSGHTVARILANPAYAGDIAYGESMSRRPTIGSSTARPGSAPRLSRPSGPTRRPSAAPATATTTSPGRSPAPAAATSTSAPPPPAAAAPTATTSATAPTAATPPASPPTTPTPPSSWPSPTSTPRPPASSPTRSPAPARGTAAAPR
jgi:hypothetical protein